MCTREEVREELQENNIKRDKNLDSKLKELKTELRGVINDKLQPLSALPVKCTERGENIVRMTEQIKTLSDEQRKTNDKLDKFVETHEKILEKMDEKYVSSEAFTPVKNLVYGLVGAVLMAVVGAVMTLILTHT